MAVTNGQRADEDTFNDAFLCKQQGGEITGAVVLNNPAEGAPVNLQTDVNQNKADIISNDNDIAQLFLDKQDLAEKGQPNGYVPLNASQKIDNIYLDDRIASIEGNWDASTNTPTLVDGTGNIGDIYVVNVAGTQDLGSGPQTFDVGDWVVYRASGVWQKTINSTAVTSVNGQTGAVSINLNDILDVNIPSPGVADDQKAVIYDNGTGTFILGQPVGTGGQGGINYVINPDIELTADNHVQYEDGAVAEPVDGDGGSPAFSVFGRSTAASDALRGDAVLNIGFTSGADRQGHGIRIELDPIDERDKFQRLQVSFDYKHQDVVSNDYADGYLRVFIYDVDNATLIGAVENDDNGDILRSTDPATFTGFFTATDSANYRLLLHVASNTTDGWTMAYDNIQVGPVGFVPVNGKNEIQENILASNITTDGVHAPLTFSNLEIGKTYNVRGNVDMTINDGGAFAAISFSSVHDGNTLDVKLLRIRTSGDTLDDNLKFPLSFSFEATATTLEFSIGGTSSFSRINGDGTRARTYIQLEKRNDLSTNLVSNTQLTQSSAGTYAHLKLPTGVLTNGFRVMIFGSVDYDPLGLYDTSTGQWTAPKNGIINASAYLEIAYGNQANITTGIEIFNVTQNTRIRGRDHHVGTDNNSDCRVDGLLEVKKGDIIQIMSFTGATGAAFGTGFEGSGFSINYEPEFTSYGVVNPNTEYRETVYAGSTGNIIDGTTYANPGGGIEFDLDLDEGEWLVGYMANVVQESTGGTGTCWMSSALHLDGTLVPGSECLAKSSITSSSSSDIHNLSNTARITLTSPQALQLRFLGLGPGSLRNRIASLNWSGGALGGDETAPKIWALRLK